MMVKIFKISLIILVIVILIFLIVTILITVIVILIFLILIVIVRRGGCEKSVCGKAVLCSPHNQVLPYFPYAIDSYLEDSSQQ